MKKYAIYIILIAAACIYRLGVDNYYLGYYNDDAAYILRSESIFASLFKKIPLPVIRPIISIGLPLLLLPSTFFSHWLKHDFYQIFMFFINIGTIYAVYLWLLKKENFSIVIITSIFVLLCPLFSWQPTKVMSELPFTLFCLLAWIGLDKCRDIILEVNSFYLSGANNLRQFFYIGLVFFLAIFTFLIRPEGFLVVILTMVFLYRYRNKLTQNFLIVSGIAILALAWFTLGQWGSVLKVYLEEIYIQYGQNLGSIIGNMLCNIKYFFIVISSWIFYWEIVPIGKTLAPVFNGIIILLITVGIYKEINHNGLKPWLLFFLGYLLWHLVWMANDKRYWIPILPYFMYYLVKGISFITNKKMIPRYFLIALLSLTMLKPNYDMIRKSIFTPSQPPWETYQWITNNIKRKDSISSYTIFRDYIWTRRLFVNIPDGVELIMVREGFKQNKIKYFFIKLDINPGYTYSRKTISDHPHPTELATCIENDKSFKKIYENKKEKTVVYEIN